MSTPLRRSLVRSFSLSAFVLNLRLSFRSARRFPMWRWAGPGLGLLSSCAKCCRVECSFNGILYSRSSSCVRRDVYWRRAHVKVGSPASRCFPARLWPVGCSLGSTNCQTVNFRRTLRMSNFTTSYGAVTMRQNECGVFRCAIRAGVAKINFNRGGEAL